MVVGKAEDAMLVGQIQRRLILLVPTDVTGGGDVTIVAQKQEDPICHVLMDVTALEDATPAIDEGADGGSNTKNTHLALQRILL